MSGLVKNQIAKQLARFTKNLSPNKISLKFLKGEGELHNLELDEITLAEVLELPPWIRLTKAVCNRISAKIHWTKLKTDPICLYLDCVEINMEAKEGNVNAPPPGSSQKHTAQVPQHPSKEKAPNRYGFVEKVVDGMFVQINSVTISFKFHAFLATFQMSRVLIQSTNPMWKADDLHMTRVKDEARGDVLTFKEVTWSTLRIDANALYDEKSDHQSAPLRLITSQSALRITIKKRLEDCAVLSARLELLLDDILWVLTQSQLQALADLLHSLTEAMSQTPARKGPANNSPQSAGSATQQQQQTHYSSSKVNDCKTDIESLNALFTQHDVRETCYHLRTGSIDLHLCDDSDLNEGGDGGAIHLKINKLSVDHYPYHLAGTSRTDWPCHNEASLTRAHWVSQLLNAFRNSQKNRPMSPEKGAVQTHHRVRSDSSLVGLDQRNGPQHPSSPLNTPSSPRVKPKRPDPPSTGSSSSHSMRNNMRHPVFMLESCFVVRCEEFYIMPVTTRNASKEEAAFLSSDKKALYLPTDMPAFQLDFTQYYYPNSVNSPVPCPNVFFQLNPIQFTLDTVTCLWLNNFFQSIIGQRRWSTSTPEQTAQPSRHIDIRIEALMPKVVIPCRCDPCAAYKELRPQALQLQASQVFITNSRIGYKCSQTDMLMFLQRFLGAKVYTDFHSFPALNSDVQPLPNSAWVNDSSLIGNDRRIDKLMNGFCQDVYDTHQPSQVWCLTAEQVWLDFLGIDDFNNRPMPFMDAVPVHMWVATPVPTYNNSGTTIESHVRRTHSASSSPPGSPVHTRTSSDVISPRRKGSEPLLSAKSQGNASCPTLVNSNASGLHNSVPSLMPNCEASYGLTPNNLPSQDGPPPAYEPEIGPQKPSHAGSELPPPYETLTHNEPILPGASEDEAPPLPEKGRLPEDLRSELTKTDCPSHEDVETAPKADLSLLVHIPQCVNLQLDHFQFVFLLRLQEMLVKLQEDLERDKPTDSNDSSDRRDSMECHPSVLFSILVREANINIVLPPAPDRDTSRLDRNPSQNTSRNASSLSSYLDTGIVPDSGCQSPEVGDFKSHSRTDSDGASLGRDGSLSSTEERISKAGQDQLLSSRPSSSQSASGRVSVSSATDPEGWLMVAGSENRSSSGLSKNRTEIDSSNFNSQVESTTSRDSNNREAGKESKEPKLVSVLSIGGEDIEVGIQFNGLDKDIKMVCPELKLEELGVIGFDKYLNQKSCKKQVSKTLLSPISEVSPMLRLRAEFGPSAERFEPTAGERGFAHIKVNGINGTLLVSTLGNLADCFEDEVLIPPMPFLVEVNNSAVSINNDLPPALISAPIAIPVDLSIENMSVRRSHTGVFHIRPMSSDSHSCNSESASMPITRQESINVSQLSLSDSASVCSRAESLESEKQCLVAQMSVSRATLQALQDERDALLKTIERLQQELSFTNREQDLLQEKMTSFQRGGRKRYR